MAIQDIILRSTNNPPLTNKGSELTFTELDTNFIEIYDYLTSMNSGSSLNPWSISTTYTGTTYVSYAGNIYKLLVATSLGEVPTSYPAVWQLTSIGELAHEVNKDTYLDKGGANEVTAQELHGLVNDQVIITTVVNFETDATNGDLIPNRLYRLTSAYPFYFVRSLTNSTYSNSGWLVERCPNITTTTRWYGGLSYVIGDKVAYKNNVYNRLTNGSTLTTPDADVVNWQYITTASFYNDEIFSDVNFIINGGSVNVFTARDKWDNVYSGNDMTYKNWAFMDGVMVSNKVTDNGSLLGDLDTLSANISRNSFKNVSSFYNPEGGFASQILDCDFNNSIIQSSQSFNGSLNNISLVNTKLKFTQGWSSSASLNQLVVIMPVLTELNVPVLYTATGGYIDSNGSTLQEFVDITSTPLTLDLDTATDQNDLLGVFNLYSTNATETIDSIARYQTAFPIKLVVSTGLTLDINLTPWATLSSNGQIVGDVAGTITLTEVDYVVLEPVIITGFNVWRVKDYTQTL